MRIRLAENFRALFYTPFYAAHALGLLADEGGHGTYGRSLTTTTFAGLARPLPALGATSPAAPF